MKRCIDCTHYRPQEHGAQFARCARKISKGDMRTDGVERWDRLVGYCNVEREYPIILAVIFGHCGSAGLRFKSKESK